MSEASEFRAYARECEELATAARLDKERDAWLKMKMAWVARADKEEVARTAVELDSGGSRRSAPRTG